MIPDRTLVLTSTQREEFRLWMSQPGVKVAVLCKRLGSRKKQLDGPYKDFSLAKLLFTGPGCFPFTRLVVPYAAFLVGCSMSIKSNCPHSPHHEEW